MSVKTAPGATDGGKPLPDGSVKVLPTAVKTNTAPQEVDEQFVRAAVNQAVSDTIGDSPYIHDSTTQWTNAIVESLVRKFVLIDRDNKYIVSCMIVQKSEAGMRSATSCFWNAQTDSGHSVTTERSDMYIITTVFICKA